MKKIILLTTIALFCILAACDDEPKVPKIPYFQSNDLCKMQLKGKVKSITINNSTYEFDRKGRLSMASIILSSCVVNYCYPVGFRADYTYHTSGKLASITTDDSNAILYEYDNHGVYVPDRLSDIYPGFFPFQDFFPEYLYFNRNLKTTYSTNKLSFYRDSIAVSGKDMVIYRNYGYDTVYITLNSAKYPEKYNFKYDEITYSYYANNMPKEIICTNELYSTKQISTYKPDDIYLLIERDLYLDVHESITTYTYNEKKDLIKREKKSSTGDVDITDYIYDEYDDADNWIKRTIIFERSGGTSSFKSEAREITYY